MSVRSRFIAGSIAGAVAALAAATPLFAQHLREVRPTVDLDWDAEILADGLRLEDPTALARGVDGSLWIVERGGRVLVLPIRGEARVFMEGLLDPKAIVPLDGDRALVLEPPLLHLMVDIDGDGRADRSQVVAGGLAGATAMRLMADGSIVVTGAPRRLRWLGDRIEGQPAAPIAATALGEDAQGRVVGASDGLVAAYESHGRAELLQPIAVHDAPIEGLAAIQSGFYVLDRNGAVARPLPSEVRWGWRGEVENERIVANFADAGARALTDDVDGGLLVLLAADGADGADGRATIVSLRPSDVLERAWPDLAEPEGDLLAQLADRDAVRRRLVREAILVRVCRGELRREEVSQAARTILRSHRDAAVRREALHLIDRAADLRADDLSIAMADADDSIRRDAVRLAGLRGEATIVTAGRLDEARSVRIEALVVSAERCVHARELLEIGRGLLAEGIETSTVAALIVSVAQEDAILDALLAAPLVGAERTLAIALIDARLRAASPPERSRILERMLDPATPIDTRSVLEERVAASVGIHDRRPRRFQLAKPPAGLSAAMGDSSTLRAIEPQLRWPGRSDVVDEDESLDDVLDRGRRLYVHCVACHGPAGLGQPGVYPPLKGSPWATGDSERFAKVLLHGLEGAITVQGRTYAGQMPKAPIVSDEELAAVMTYVRRAWGNDADPVSPATVRAVRSATAERTRPWTPRELDVSGEGSSR